MSMNREEKALWKEVMLLCLEQEHLKPKSWPAHGKRNEHAALVACEMADTVILNYRESLKVL